MLTLMLAYLLVDGMFKPLFQRPRPDSAVYAVSPKRELPPIAAFVVVPIRARGVHVRCRPVGGLGDVAGGSRRVVGAGEC